MASVRNDHDAVWQRLTTTLREIEDRMQDAAAPSDLSDEARARLGLAESAMAANRLRFAAHFPNRKLPTAAASQKSRA